MAGTSNRKTSAKSETTVEEKVQELSKQVEAEAKKKASPITVTLAHYEPGVRIFYTLDGTYPLPNTATEYDGPFKVEAGTTVKAISVDGHKTSKVLTRQY